MKEKFLLSVLLLSTGLTGFCTTWTITNSGMTFTPASITIILGDSVNFIIAAAHNAVEVSDSTWNANDNTALPGGFQAPFGGGLILPAQLVEGIHYYVCYPHAPDAMKGIIIVQHHEGINEIYTDIEVNAYPNPSADGAFQIQTGNGQWATGNMEIYNVFGEKIISGYKAIFSSGKLNLDLSELPAGNYFARIRTSSGIFYSKLTVIK